MIALAIASLTFANSSPTQVFINWGTTVLNQIRNEFYDPNTHLYSESRTATTKSGPSFAWPAGVLLLALDAGSQCNPEFTPWLSDYAASLRTHYWDGSASIPGFYSSTSQGQRYYDDNEWIARGQIAASQTLNSSTLASQYRETLAFAQSGYSSAAGGGIYWREGDTTTKNTCSNAPQVVALLESNSISPNSTYVTQAEQIYNWTRDTLMDPDTNLYFDNLNLSTNTIQKTFWTYNTAEMILGGAYLSAATQDKAYGAQALASEAASIRHWLTPVGGISDEGKFAYLLIEAWLKRVYIARQPEDKLGATLQAVKVMKYVHDHVQDPNGHYPDRWDNSSQTKLSTWNLIDQAAVARAFFECALWSMGKHGI